MIARPTALSRLEEGLRVHPAAALLGPRQCGKTTLARQLAEHHGGAWFDLESPVDRARLEDPLLALEGLAGLVVIDGFQRRPDLFDVLRVPIDRPNGAAQYLLLGSASPQLVRGVSESLAGRVGFVDLGGFDLSEVDATEADRLWLRGGFPRSFLAPDEEASALWHEGFALKYVDAPRSARSSTSSTRRRRHGYP